MANRIKNPGKFGFGFHFISTGKKVNTSWELKEMLESVKFIIFVFILFKVKRQMDFCLHCLVGII